MTSSKSHNKLLSSFFVLALCLGGISALFMATSEDNSSGATPAGYIPVSNADDLARVGSGISFGGYSWSLSASYYQTTDIQLTGVNNFNPIGNFAGGTSTDVSQAFSGTYDGNHKKIIGLHAIQTKSDSGSLLFALFRAVNDATLKNITVDNANFVLTTDVSSTSSMITGNVHSAIFAYYVLGSSVIEQCAVVNSTISGNISAEVPGVKTLSLYAFVGSLLGTSQVRDCYVANVDLIDSSTTSHYRTAGGISGPNWDASLSNFHVNGLTLNTVNAVPLGVNQIGAVIAYPTLYPIPVSNLYYSDCNLSDATATHILDPTDQSKYVGFDFENVWEMGADYPVFLSPLVTISGTPATGFVGVEYSFSPFVNPSDAVMTISGPAWLSVYENSIIGTPIAPGTYNVVITVTKAGFTSAEQTFAITVYEKLVFLSSPSAGYWVEG